MIHNDDEWVIQEKEILFPAKKNVLGEGRFGVVVKGRWRGIPVAVKSFSGEIDETTYDLIRKEFDAMTRLHHPNIVQLLGYMKQPTFGIVMEYAHNGSLGEYLSAHPWTSLKRKMCFVTDVAKGMAYLHARKPSLVIHRDIKPNNFLVTEHLQVKIADFGLCAVLRNLDPDALDLRSEKREYRGSDGVGNGVMNVPEYSATANVGTLRYMAPELLRRSQQKRAKYTPKVDIYSLGCVIFEIFEGRPILSECEDTNEFIKSVTDPRFVPVFCRSRGFIQKLTRMCLDSNPLRRPSALSVAEYLNRKCLEKPWLAFFFR